MTVVPEAPPRGFWLRRHPPSSSALVFAVTLATAGLILTLLMMTASSRSHFAGPLEGLTQSSASPMMLTNSGAGVVTGPTLGAVGAQHELQAQRVDADSVAGVLDPSGSGGGERDLDHHHHLDVGPVDSSARPVARTPDVLDRPASGSAPQALARSVLPHPD